MAIAAATLKVQSSPESRCAHCSHARTRLRLVYGTSEATPAILGELLEGHQARQSARNKLSIQRLRNSQARCRSFLRHSYSSQTDGQRPAALVIELPRARCSRVSILSLHVIMSLAHMPDANTAWQHPQALPTPHGPHQAYGLAGLPPDLPLPQPPMVSSSLASPFHPGTTLKSSQGGRSKNGDRFHDVRQLFARRELERQSSVATRGGKRCFCGKELEDEEDIYCSSGALGLFWGWIQGLMSLRFPQHVLGRTPCRRSALPKSEHPTLRNPRFLRCRPLAPPYRAALRLARRRTRRHR